MFIWILLYFYHVNSANSCAALKEREKHLGELCHFILNALSTIQWCLFRLLFYLLTRSICPQKYIGGVAASATLLNVRRWDLKAWRRTAGTSALRCMPAVSGHWSVCVCVCAWAVGEDDGHSLDRVQHWTTCLLVSRDLPVSVMW